MNYNFKLSHMKIFLEIVIFTCKISILTFSLKANSQWIQHSFDVMGTRSNVEFEISKNQDGEQILKKIVSEMHRIDALMSPYKANSELSKINTTASIQPVKISQELFDLLVKSNEFSVLTYGAFDISFSSLGYLYDYRNSVKPTKDQIANLKNIINYQSIKLNKKTLSVKYTKAKVKIDLGGIAKGHAVDQCIQILKNNGIVNAYVSAGGDTRIIGKKDDRLWYIGIKHPRNENKLLVNLPLEEVSISTSGDYERFFIKNGVRYHHIIDPKTGESASELQSVTILAPNSTMADALSTSVFVLGSKKGLKLINNLPDISAILVDSQGLLYFSNDLEKLD
ncbi:MAG: thiamine biosynthesis lipoprotein [Polaribacter sp.]|jgi:thiamine biosynthesis lipoprotein